MHTSNVVRRSGKGIAARWPGGRGEPVHECIFAPATEKVTKTLCHASLESRVAGDLPRIKVVIETKRSDVRGANSAHNLGVPEAARSWAALRAPAGGSTGARVALSRSANALQFNDSR